MEGGACQRMLYFDDLSIIPENSNNQAKALFRPGPKLTASHLACLRTALDTYLRISTRTALRIFYILFYEENKMKRLFTFLSVISESTIANTLQIQLMATINSILKGKHEAVLHKPDLWQVF